MSAKLISRERVTARIGRRNCDYYLEATKLAETELVEQAIWLFLCVVHSGNFEEMQELFEYISYEVEANQQKGVTDDHKNKLLTSALEIYCLEIEEYHNKDYESFRDKIIEMLEQEIPLHLDPKNLFIYTMLSELIYSIANHALAEKLPTEIEQAIH